MINKFGECTISNLFLILVSAKKEAQWDDILNAVEILVAGLCYYLYIAEVVILKLCLQSSYISLLTI